MEMAAFKVESKIFNIPRTEVVTFFLVLPILIQRLSFPLAQKGYDRFEKRTRGAVPGKVQKEPLTDTWDRDNKVTVKRFRCDGNGCIQK